MIEVIGILAGIFILSSLVFPSTRQLNLIY